MKILRYYLSESETTRRNEKIDKVEKIAIYKIKSQNTALEYRLYIENLKKQEDIYFSVHYIIDSYGNVLNIIPEKEISVHDENNIQINYTAISILVLEGKDDKVSYNNTAELISKITKKYNLNIAKDIMNKESV